MLKYLMQNGEYQRAKGVAVWRTMEKLQVLFAGQKRADIAACMLCVVPWRNCRYCLPVGSVWALQRACCVVYRGETAGTIYLSEACGRCNVHGIDSLRGLNCQSHKQPQPITVSQMTSQCHK